MSIADKVGRLTAQQAEEYMRELISTARQDTLEKVLKECLNSDEIDDD